MSGQVRKYISSLDAGGRLTVIRSDGQPLTFHEKKWFDSTITGALKQQNILARVEEMKSEIPEVGEVHPTLMKLDALVSASTFSMQFLSQLIGRRRNSLSEWLRGLAKPFYQDVYALFGLFGYRLIPVPIRIEHDVLAMVRDTEEKYKSIEELESMGGENDDAEVHSGTRAAGPESP